MRHSVSILVAALLVSLSTAACNGNNPPTSPSTTAPPKFTATLLPANEVPPTTNADATGSGTATITLNVTRDSAQNITAATADFVVTLTGFPANTSLTGAHIHSGRPDVASGGVVVSLGLVSGEIVLATGATTFSKTGINVGAVVAQNMINDPVGFYFNVHTTINTGGAVRAPLVRQ